MIIGRIRNGRLHSESLKITVSDLDTDASSEFIVGSELKCDFLGHPDKLLVQETKIDGVGLKRIFRADAFLFMIGNDRRFINAVCLSPEVDTIFPKQIDEHFYRYLAQDG